MTLMVDFPFPGTDAWVGHFKAIDLPVLRLTAKKLMELQENAEDINTRNLAAIVMHDPLMTLRVLRYMQAHRSPFQNADITTMERALVMIGTSKFFELCQDLPIIEQQLKGHPKAMLGLLKVITRSRHAAGWARDWALFRQNTRFDEISLAAMLHDSVEILMYCTAPSLALRAQERHLAQPKLRTQTIQEEVFGASLNDIMQELIKDWGLPELLQSLLDPADAQLPNVRNVSLAVDLARHVANGWKDPAIPDDLRAIESLLHMGHAKLLESVGAPKEMVQAAKLAELD